MTSSKLFLVTLVFILPLLFILTFYLKTPLSQPAFSDTQNFLNQLQDALSTSQLEPLNLSIRDFNHQTEFYLQPKEQIIPTKVVLSTQKNPYWQIAVLQKTLKEAKIKNTFIKTINLSLNHPYATLKNY